jgi:hypothetical protein
MGHQLAGQQAKKVRLAGSVAAEHGDSLAVKDLQVEWPGKPNQLQADAGQRADAGAPPAQPHHDLLLARTLLRRSGRFELPQPRLRRLVSAGHPVVAGRLLPQGPDQLDEPGMLLVPPATQLV